MFKKSHKNIETGQYSPEQSKEQKDWEIAMKILDCFFKGIGVAINHIQNNEQANTIYLREAIRQHNLTHIETYMTNILNQQQDYIENLIKEQGKQHDMLYKIARSNCHEVNALRLISDIPEAKCKLLNQLAELIYHSNIDISAYQLKSTNSEARFKEILTNILNDILEEENDPYISLKPGKLERLADLDEAKTLIKAELKSEQEVS